MRARSSTEVLIDFMNNADDAALVTRMAVELGFRIRIDSDPESYSDDVTGVVAVLDHKDRALLEREIGTLIALLALTNDISIEQVIQRVRSTLEDGYDLSKSPREQGNG